ncbi:MAG: hypothetical protein ACRD0W_19770, partial [Acidimicrobiales bacterium]
FTGMYALTQNINVKTAVRDGSNNRSTVLVTVKAQAIPIFQFAAFFDGDFEDYSYAEKHINGRVHGNGNMYLNGPGLYFHGFVTTPKKLRRDSKTEHNDPVEWVRIDDAAAIPTILDFDSQTHPSPAAFRAQSDAKFDGRLMTDAYGVPTLNLPLPTGTPPREIIRPRELSDSDEEKEAKFAWQADMYVTVDLSNLVAKHLSCGAPVTTTLHPMIDVVRYDGGPALTNPKKCNVFNFKFDAFGNRHEMRWVDALTVQLDTLRAWLTSVGGPKPDVIYIEFKPRAGDWPTPYTTTNPSNETSKRPFPVLRLKGGTQLHGPLTIGSEYPFYVMGNYNTTSKQPAAVFGDTYTFLSSNYPDGPPYTIPDKPLGANVTHNLSLVHGTGEGYVGCYHHDAGCVPPASGGAGWFRSLEDMTGFDYTFRGSFVSLWGPVYARIWGNCNECGGDGYHYARPTNRYTLFDTDLLDPAKLPPATPVVGNVFHTAFRPVY